MPQARNAGDKCSEFNVERMKSPQNNGPTKGGAKMILNSDVGNRSYQIRVMQLVK
jgi:hypothetical protein